MTKSASLHMAESHKASVNPKEKSSLLDEEIDTDFLSSWKSMSVMEDGGMDFSFSTVSKGKKKVFDFDKLDMDFNLDGDFNKLSSFKVDMSDLDFSSPPRKAAKTKETEEEPSSRGNRQGKQNNFNFSFDFNELDNFDLDSSLRKSEKNSKKNPDSSKEVVSDKIGSPCSKIKLAEENSTPDGDFERVATSKVDTSLVVSGNVNSMNDDRASESETSENLKLPQDTRPLEKVCTRSVEESYATQATIDHESDFSKKAMPIEPHSTQVIHDLQSDLSEKGMPEEPQATQATNDQQCDLSGKEMPAEPHATQAIHQPSDLSEVSTPTEPHATQETHNFPGQFIGGVDSNGDTVFKGKDDGGSHVTKVNTISSGKEDVSDKIPVGDCPNHEELPLKDSYPMNIAGSGTSSSDRSKSGSLISTGNAEPPTDDLDLEDNSCTLVAKKIPHYIESIKEDQNSTVKLPLSIHGSESSADKVTLTIERKTGEFHSKISKRLEESGSQFFQPSLVGANSLSSGIKRSGTMPLRPTIDHGMGANANDAQIGSKLFANPVLVDRETKVKHVVPGSEGFNSDSVSTRAKLTGNSRLRDKEVTEREPVVGNGQKKNINNDLSLESMRNTKITAEGNKLCPDKPAKNKADLSTWNISKNIGGNKVSVNSTPQKEVKSMRSSEKNMEVQGNVELKTQIVDCSVKQMSPNLSLKRKTLEGSDSGLSSLRSLKRLSQSPREIRNVQGPSKGVVEEKVQIHDGHLQRKSKSSSGDHLSSGLGSPSAVNAMELEIHSLMENDGNVEKAEAYTKELEDICNMLKKKHEEAKEMLVRAVVNNNNLLMLNHPIYEAKIQKIQQFAAKLTSKGLHTCSRSPTVVM